MNHLRALTLSLHPRAGLNPAWVPGSRFSSTAISRRTTTAVSSLIVPVADETDRPPHQLGRDTLRVPHHATYSEEFIRSVHGPSVGFYGHVVTPSRFATAEPRGTLPVLREGRQTVVTFIDYSAAFDTESQLFIVSALAETGISSKGWRIVQVIFAAATGVVRALDNRKGALICRNHLRSREACCRVISSHPCASSQG